VKIIKPYVMVPRIDTEKLMRKIERCGRVCYQSEPAHLPINFVAGIIRKGHESVIEHESVTVHFIVDRGVSHEIVRHRLASYSQESTRYCLAGDTKLSFSNPRYHMTLRELYDNKINSVNGSWRRIKIRQLNEDSGVLEYSTIKDVIFNGVRPVYEVRTELGYALRCTGDHRIYTPSGYTKLSDLAISDLIYVNGISTDMSELYKNKDWLYYQNITLNKTFVSISEEFGYNLSTLKKWARKLGIPKKGTGYFNEGREPWNKGLTEFDDDRVDRQSNALREYHYDSSKKGVSIMKSDTSQYRKHAKDRCEVCGNDDTRSLEVHHKDEDRGNNDPSNLLTVCESCHLRIHSKNVKILFSDKIVSITFIGDTDVYDIEMPTYHNFVANGVIVHNCNYANGKFGNKITVIEPFFFNGNENGYHDWIIGCDESEVAYMRMLNAGRTSQEARSVLPNSLKTELVMTANLREWRHFFKLRADVHAHPQMQQVAIPLLAYFKQSLPIIYADIEYNKNFPAEHYAEVKIMEDW